MKKAAVVSQGGFTSNYRIVLGLAAPPLARFETLGPIAAWNRAREAPRGSVIAMLTAQQTIATRRKYGAHRYRFVVAHDQHDFAKVNSRIGSVKIFFSNIGSD
jgi:hypothetical protein